MNGLRKWLCFLICVATLPVAAPATAGPSKLYSLAMCVGTFDDAGNDPTHCAPAQTQIINNQTLPTPIQARIFNFSPPNTNSTINSVDLFALVNWHEVQASVQILDNANATKAGITVNGAHLMISNLAPIKPGGKVTIQFNVDNFSCGFSLWNVTAYTGSGFTGSTFAPAAGFSTPGTNVACGQFTCGSVTPQIQPQGSKGSTDPRYVSFLQRGPYNTDGVTGGFCSTLFAYVTPTITTSGTTITSAQLQTVWDKPPSSDADVAVFKYAFNLPQNGVTDPVAKRAGLQVAWLLNAGAPDFRPALNCEAHVYTVGGNPMPGDLPAPIASLVADNGNKLSVSNPANVPLDVPFSIVVEDERMIVTKIVTNTSGISWFVTRGVGGTTQAFHPSTDPPLPVMSTPFPLVTSSDGYPASYVGLPARVCVNNFVQSTIDLTQFTATVIDNSDGWVRGF